MTSIRTQRRAALWLGIVFVAGFALGAVVMGLYPGLRPDHRSLSPGEYRVRLLNMLSRDLDLDEEQKQQLEVILDEIGERFQSVREAMEPEFEAIRSERAERVMALLTAMQRGKYERILEERRRRRHAPGRDRPPGSPPH